MAVLWWVVQPTMTLCHEEVFLFTIHVTLYIALKRLLVKMFCKIEEKKITVYFYYLKVALQWNCKAPKINNNIVYQEMVWETSNAANVLELWMSTVSLPGSGFVLWLTEVGQKVFLWIQWLNYCCTLWHNDAI